MFFYDKQKKRGSTMNLKKIIIIVVCSILALILVIGTISGYNSLVDADEAIAADQSQIEIRLQERHDKIGLIVDAITGLQEHEETIYDMITSARAAYATAKTNNDTAGMIEADALESLALSNLLVAVEDNPALTTTGAYGQLIVEISSIEAALAVARRDYNNSVESYNASVRRFPKVLYASLFGFTKSYAYWKMNAGADEIPEVVF
jgi:LemA protein